MPRTQANSMPTARTGFFDRDLDVERTSETIITMSSSTWDGATPANGQTQLRNSDVKFSHNDTSVPIDWHEAYVLIGAKIDTLAGGVASTRVSATSLPPGSFSLIKELWVNSSGKELYKGLNVAPIIFMRKCLEEGRAYAETIGSNEMFFLDKPENLLIEAPATVADPAKNAGAMARSFQKGQIRIPLKNWGFFKALKNRLLPPVNLDIRLNFQKDAELLWGVGFRLVIETVELKAPAVYLKKEREAALLESITAPQMFAFPEESFRDQYGVGNLPAFGGSVGDGVVNPISVFAYTTAKGLMTTAKRKYAFNTFQFNPTRILLKYGNNTETIFPDGAGYKYLDKTRIFGDLMNYAYRVGQPGGGGTCLDRWTWENLYPFVLFDMSKMSPGGLAETRNLRIEIDYGTVPNAEYTLCTGLIQQVQVAIQRIGGQSVIVRQ